VLHVAAGGIKAGCQEGTNDHKPGQLTCGEPGDIANQQKNPGAESGKQKAEEKTQTGRAAEVANAALNPGERSAGVDAVDMGIRTGVRSPRYIELETGFRGANREAPIILFKI
jgi:hypothetical protein